MLSSRPIGIAFEGDYRQLTKTPGNRMLKSRSALQENVGRYVPVTVDGKATAKKAALQQTSLHPNTLQPQKILKDHDGTIKFKGKEPVILAPSRPLGDKTPFPNRIANHATPLQMTKPMFVTPGALLRPSSARKHVRLPRSASKSFQTPVTGGNHWDVSDIDINPEVTAAPSQSIEEDDYDEIEYMPPKLPEMPYEPPFELPNYKEVGRTLLALTHSYPIDDMPPDAMTFTEFTAAESDDKFFASSDLSLPHLDDDSPFSRTNPAPKPEPEVTRAPPSSKNTTRPTQTTTRPLRTIRAASTVAHSTPADTSRLRSGPQAVSRTAATRVGMTTSKPATRAASSAAVVRGHPSRTPSTRAPSTTVSRAPSTTATTRTRPASTLPTGIKHQAGPASGKFGTQPKASTNMKSGMSTKKTAQGIGIVFGDSWQEEEFRFSV
ncbi:hypothetical protein DEU56DRAFT_891492 [Suillus clintonianus]|uniref:uncharacterized protein n=1 Tax=Suillus clintonianus TaxID=1904413 RepID=UPI001B871F81|nr:uncharacterized protein DEU56DRAFT_891492 [Suillus clintonianus]KAG2127494.1 hypothetical protein DEU56DRAFT_891492 [Suillus clintonianus]